MPPPKSPLPIRRCPKTFEENKSIMGRDREVEMAKFLDALEKDFQEGDVIMEHGGVHTGSTAKHLAPVAEKKNCKIYGVENCEAMVQHAKDNFSHPRVEYVFGELTDPDFALKDVKFNRIISIYYLNFLTTDYKDELKAMYELLAPGGEVFIVLGHSKMFFDLMKNVKNHEEFGEHGDHMPDMSWITEILEKTEQWKQEIQETIGFKTKELTIQKKDYSFDKLKVIADMFLSYNSFAHQLPEDKKNNLRDMYVKHFMETPTDVHTPHDKLTEHHEYKFEYDTVNIHLKKD